MQVMDMMKMKEKWFYTTGETYWLGEGWLDSSQHSAWLTSILPWRALVVCSLGMCVHVWVCETMVRVAYVIPRWSGWLSDHPDGVESLIGGAELGICVQFWFVQCICVSGCVIEVYTVIPECVLLWLCGSAFVSGISGVSQPLLMYQLIT